MVDGPNEVDGAEVHVGGSMADAKGMKADSDVSSAANEDQIISSFRIHAGAVDPLGRLHGDDDSETDYESSHPSTPLPPPLPTSASRSNPDPNPDPDPDPDNAVSDLNLMSESTRLDSLAEIDEDVVREAEEPTQKDEEDEVEVLNDPVASNITGATSSRSAKTPPLSTSSNRAGAKASAETSAAVAAIRAEVFGKIEEAQSRTLLAEQLKREEQERRQRAQEQSFESGGATIDSNSPNTLGGVSTGPPNGASQWTPASRSVSPAKEAVPAPSGLSTPVPLRGVSAPSPSPSKAHTSLVDPLVSSPSSKQQPQSSKHSQREISKTPQSILSRCDGSEIAPSPPLTSSSASASHVQVGNSWPH